jgi:hypothetical protein
MNPEAIDKVCLPCQITSGSGVSSSSPSSSRGSRGFAIEAVSSDPMTSSRSGLSSAIFGVVDNLVQRMKRASMAPGVVVRGPKHSMAMAQEASAQLLASLSQPSLSAAVQWGPAFMWVPIGQSSTSSG